MTNTHLMRNLGHDFRRPELLTEALTHRSASGRNNERLEFLGDALLSSIIAEKLFHTYPKSAEGELSRLRASLVNRDTLADLARRLELGDCLHLGPGELKSGGYRRSSILADTLEAVFAAVYLDSDFLSCRQLILHLYEPLFADLLPAAELKDPKTRLQERLQSEQKPLPVYSVLEISGEAHNQRFRVECVIGPDARTEATASSRRRAEQEAARLALESLS